MLAVENSAVFQGSENRVVEVLEKEITDEILAGNAAASVIQQNSVIWHIFLIHAEEFGLTICSI
jgi:hypothetical protein